MENEKKFYLPSTEVSESIHSWLKQKAESEKRSLTQQLIWELEKISKKEAK